MDSDDESEDTQIWKGVAGSVILINILDPNQYNTASVAYAATCRMVRQYLRTSSSENIGVCLYGIEGTDSSVSDTSVVDVFPLTLPTLDDFKKLQSVVLSSYTQAKELKLSNVLWHCSKMFANCKKKLSSRTVILLTRLDIPPFESDQKPSLKRIDDLVDSNIEIKVINIAKNNYKVDEFYESFLMRINKGREINVPKPIWDSKEIEKVMHQQSHRHLAVARLNFVIGDGFTLGVGVYNLLIRSPQYQQKKVNLDRESNAIVTSVTKTMKVSVDEPGPSMSMDVDGEESAPTQMPVLKSELLYYQEYGGERINFTDSEMKRLRNPFGPPMMKLLGFKPLRVMCKEKWYLKTGYFLFPNESLIEGSTVAFKAMHKACTETSVVAICVLCTRVNARPSIVALSPCTQPLGLDVEIGFDIIQIPFAESVRDIPAVGDDDEDKCITESQKALMTNIIQRVKFDYKPDMFQNPTLQAKYRAIEAIALEEEDLDPFVDTTKPGPEKFQGIEEDLFEELFGPFGPAAPKRTLGQTHNNTNKRAKNQEIDERYIHDCVRYQTVHKFTVDDLKKILKRKQDSNMPPMTGLKKNQLVDLVYKYYGD